MSKKTRLLTTSQPNALQRHEIQYLDIPMIKVDPDHPRTPTEQQINKALRCIEATTFVPYVVVDKNNTIIYGQEWFEAVKLLGHTGAAVIRADSLTAEQTKVLSIAYAKTIESGKWDFTLLKKEFEFLYNADIDLRATGFETPEIDFIIVSGQNATDASLDDAIVEPKAADAAVSQIGDIWQLGAHRLINGNALDAHFYESLIGDNQIQAVVSDPPYNVPVKGHMGGKGAIQHREFVQASGEMSDEQFEDFLLSFLGLSLEKLVKGGLIYCFMDWRGQLPLLTAISKLKLIQLNLAVWRKTNAGMGSFYRSAHELVHIFKSGKDPHINNVQLGKHGRYRTNVWDYPGVNTFIKGSKSELAMHPTVKPVAMIADIIMDATNLGDHVLDPFAGSGTIFIACERTRRVGFGIELDPLYVDTAIRRWQRFTGKEAVHAVSGKTFTDHEREQATSAVKEVRRVRNRRK